MLLRDFVNNKMASADKEASAEGYPLTLNNCKKYKKMKQLQIFGNSVQDGTPTPEAPIELQSVGELVTDTTDFNYGKYKIPVTTRGKNVFCHKSFEIGGATRLEYGYNSDGSDYAVLKGDVNSSTTSQMISSQGWYVPSRANTTMTLRYGQTVTISADITALERHDEKCQEKMRIYLYAKGGVASYAPTTDIWYELGKKQRVSRTITLTKPEYDNLTWYPVFTLNSHTMRIENIMIEINDEATSFEPYIEPATTNVFLNEPLRKIGDYADYIDFKGNKVVRNVREVIFKGGEIKRKLAYYETNLGYSLWVTPENEYANVNMNYFNKNGIHPELSTHFVAETKTNSATVKHGEWYISFDAIYLAIAVGTYETVADVNNWLSSQHDNGTPVKFDYILAEPTEEPIDCDLPKLKAKASIIEVGTSTLPSNAYGKYIKK